LEIGEFGKLFQVFETKELNFYLKSLKKKEKEHLKVSEKFSIIEVNR